MSYVAEGTICIPLDDFFDFAAKFGPQGCEIGFGVPRVNRENRTIDVDFAAATDYHPSELSEEPAALRQWEQDA